MFVSPPPLLHAHHIASQHVLELAWTLQVCTKPDDSCYPSMIWQCSKELSVQSCWDNGIHQYFLFFGKLVESVSAQVHAVIKHKIVTYCILTFNSVLWGYFKASLLFEKLWCSFVLYKSHHFTHTVPTWSEIHLLFSYLPQGWCQCCSLIRGQLETSFQLCFPFPLCAWVCKVSSCNI